MNPEERTHAEAVEDLRDDLLSVLQDYPVNVWGDGLAAAVAALFQSKLDAAEIAAEEKARRAEV